jgi:hypothetical protein
MSAEYHRNQPELDPSLVAAYAHTFFSRSDRYPKQQADGSYITVHQPLDFGLVAQHLLGQITLGAYLLGKDSSAKTLCFDADTPAAWDALLTLARTLAQRGITTYLETSRRGGHLWLFITPMSGLFARRFGSLLLADHGLSGIELYPKQDQLTTGPGSLVRLPLGVHRLTGRRYSFITPDGQPLAPTIREQIALLSSPVRVPFDFISPYLVRSLPPAQPPKLESKDIPPAPQNTLSERIKARISVLQFVSRYVELDGRNSGFCPFHDDQKKSFSVNAEGNYWRCFAGCKGNTVIDFWMLWRAKHGQDGSFTATVQDLRQILF